MTIRSIEDLMIDDILEREGSEFTNDPLDRGGATKFGITQRSWERYLNAGSAGNRLTLPSFVRDITEPEAREFYAVTYYRPLAWINDIELRELVLDSAVNCGADRAVKWLQRASSCLAIDGVIGPETRMRVNEFGNATRGIDAGPLRRMVIDQREDHYIDVCKRDPSQLRFLSGWMKRLRMLRP